jgi:hypothetical protein
MTLVLHNFKEHKENVCETRAGRLRIFAPWKATQRKALCVFQISTINFNSTFSAAHHKTPISFHLMPLIFHAQQLRIKIYCAIKFSTKESNLLRKREGREEENPAQMLWNRWRERKRKNISRDNCLKMRSSINLQDLHVAPRAHSSSRNDSSQNL